MACSLSRAALQITKHMPPTTNKKKGRINGISGAELQTSNDMRRSQSCPKALNLSARAESPSSSGRASMPRRVFPLLGGSRATVFGQTSGFLHGHVNFLGWLGNMKDMQKAKKAKDGQTCWLHGGQNDGRTKSRIQSKIVSTARYHPCVGFNEIYKHNRKGVTGRKQPYKRTIFRGMLTFEKTCKGVGCGGVWDVGCGVLGGGGVERTCTYARQQRVCASMTLITGLGGLLTFETTCRPALKLPCQIPSRNGPTPLQSLQKPAKLETSPLEICTFAWPKPTAILQLSAALFPALEAMSWKCTDMHPPSMLETTSRISAPNHSL